jgi:hypothetical protein
MALPVELVGVCGIGRDGFVRVEAAGFAIQVSTAAGGFRAVKYRDQSGSWIDAGRVDTDG